ncbi:flavin monoamine oxidase family protein [Curtobacterium sp. MCBD17_032]|uniref:flavin monoamine oxidase family protein n=1 Tax=Curtobacterium sp. MCBD17_032 TaxID=2175659 RepID=UPI000DA93AE6|nr:flavin monoamine oxidase family protein [Curtobacterium sp. MCBD17_032]PZE86844.1 monooxygenase [Curtobacterium sp. MCBD17_032]
MTTTSRSVDVVIVGAGLAGLSAADQLTQQGHDVLVLEGRERVGGRIHTTSVAGVPVDAGATWVAPDHTAMHALIDRLGGSTVPQFHDGKGLISFGGRRRAESALALAPWVVLDLARITGKLQRIVDHLPTVDAYKHPRVEEYDAVSLGDWLTKQHALKDTRRFVDMISKVHWGAPAGDISLFNALRYFKTLGGLEHMMSVEGGDQQDRIAGTVHTLVERFAETLGPRVIVDAPVRKITTHGTTVTVETDSLTVDARYVIVTAAPAHRSAITFEPALPEQHRGLSRTWRLGALSKAFVAYDRPFWRDSGLSGEAVSDDDTVFLTFDVSSGLDRPGILMVFCDPRGFDSYDRGERSERVLAHLVHLYGSEALRITDYEDFAWGNDTFAPGGPNPAVAPRAWTTFGRFLRQPVGHVHWAGTETADETSGTMNGAVLSGHRAATDVAALLAVTSEPSAPSVSAC